METTLGRAKHGQWFTGIVLDEPIVGRIYIEGVRGERAYLCQDDRTGNKINTTQGDDIQPGFGFKSSWMVERDDNGRIIIGPQQLSAITLHGRKPDVPPAPVEVELNGKRTATVKSDHLTVGCERIEFAAIAKLSAAIKKMTDAVKAKKPARKRPAAKKARKRK